MRVLVCLDAVPAADGSCAQQAWVEQPTFADYLPTPEEAHVVGFSFFSSLILIAAAVRSFKPRR